MVAEPRGRLGPLVTNHGEGDPGYPRQSPITSVSGVDAECDAFKLQFEAYCELLGVGEIMEVAESQSSAIEHDGISEAVLAVSRALNVLLVTKCEGKALSIVSLAPKRHGLECWRQLKL